VCVREGALSHLRAQERNRERKGECERVRAREQESKCVCITKRGKRNVAH